MHCRCLLFFTLFLAIGWLSNQALAADLLSVINAINYLPSYAGNGCEEKATLVSLELESAGIPSAKIEISVPDGDHLISDPTGRFQWIRHVAVLLVRDKRSKKWISASEEIYQGKKNPSVDLFVYDPLFGKKILTQREWLRAVKAPSSVEIAVSPADLSLGERSTERGISHSCNRLMHYHLLEDLSLAEKQRNRENLFTRVENLTRKMRQEAGKKLECDADIYKKQTGNDLYMHKGASFAVLLDPKDEFRCKIGFGRGAAAVMYDEYGERIDDGGETSYLDARINQARSDPTCYKRNGTLTIDSAEYFLSTGYAFSGNNRLHYYEVKGHLQIHGQKNIAVAVFHVTHSGSIRTSRIKFPSGQTFFSLGTDDLRFGEDPYFDDRYAYGESLGKGIKPLWFAPYEDTKRLTVHQVVFFQ